MKTITVRQLRRQRWSEIQAALRREEEILITRDSKPVAKLVRISEPVRKRKRWDPRRAQKMDQEGMGEQTSSLGGQVSSH
jgi:antitoxin (DNA-binding transcriptional repressor) of toxin-antitoxin stability system